MSDAHEHELKKDRQELEYRGVWVLHEVNLGTVDLRLHRPTLEELAHALDALELLVDLRSKVHALCREQLEKRAFHKELVQLCLRLLGVLSVLFQLAIKGLEMAGLNLAVDFDSLNRALAADQEDADHEVALLSLSQVALVLEEEGVVHECHHRGDGRDLVHVESNDLDARDAPL